MSRISSVFESLKNNNQKALIPYITAGDPNLDITVPLMHEMVKAGANIIELGIPFSDPMADGPVIQKASERALVHNTSLMDVFNLVKQFREDDKDTPIILMGYLNPIEIMGYQNFVDQAHAADIDGVLIVDFPPEESHEFNIAMKEKELDTIFLLSPTTTDNRIKLICDQASGFVYYVAIKGVTGSAQLDTADIADRITHIKNMTQLPIGVGFGIKNAETASKLGAAADAVIVGSANVQLIESGIENNLNNQAIMQNIFDLLSSMRVALNQLK
ncbi:MAG: tryptophan synthase subunit alpha [Gammaproteobacteria bacterium]|nr:tryptophan synthase subunit alpha [Gammaproteobacteria bacterium]